MPLVVTTTPGGYMEGLYCKMSRVLIKVWQNDYDNSSAITLYFLT